MTPRPWNMGEVKILRTFAGLGAEAVATLLERSIGSVEAKAKELRVSLVVTGEDIDVTLTPTQILARLREVPDLQICPLCGMRLATMKATGMCRPCHLDQLIALRETQLAEAIRQRKLTSLRQNKHRLRICEACDRPFYPRPESKTARCAECGGGE